MMCKAKAWVLALTAGLLLLLIPAQARADVTRLLILNDEQTSETSAAATDVLRRFALYSSWTCTGGPTQIDDYSTSGEYYFYCQ